MCDLSHLRKRVRTFLIHSKLVTNLTLLTVCSIDPELYQNATVLADTLSYVLSTKLQLDGKVVPTPFNNVCLKYFIDVGSYYDIFM